MSTPVRARSDNDNAELVSTCPRRLLESGDATTSGSACCGTESRDEDAEEYNVLQLERLCTVEAPKFPELHFCCGYALDDNKKKILIVTQRQLANHPPFGYVSRARITLQEDGKYEVHILMQNIENGVFQNESEVHELLQRYSKSSVYKFCPGIEWSYYLEHYHEVIKFDIKIVCRTPSFQQIDSVNCKMWFELPLNASFTERNSTAVKCSACKRLCTDLDWQLKRTLSESPTKKIARQAASSKARVSYMSPFSQQKRKQNAAMERGIHKRKLAKYENTEITLADEQHTQMCDVMSIIDGTVGDDLQKIFEEGEIHGVRSKLKEIWMTDKRQNLEQFQKDQANNGKSELMML